MKYRVLKEFIDAKGHFHRKVGDTFERTKDYENGNGDPTFLGELYYSGFIEEIKDGPWKPKDGERYFYVYSDGHIEWNTWEDTDFIHNRRFVIGNCFQTKEQDEKAVEWLKAFKVLRDDAKGFKANWENPDQDKFTVFYDHTDKYFGVIKHSDTQAELIIFATEADAAESINKHEKEWKIFLSVED